MQLPEQVLYTGTATSAGGREGTIASDDGRLSATLSTPKELGGDSGPGTNPEQMFAAGYSACFIGALKFVAGAEKVKLTADLGDIDKQTAQMLVDKAHQVCPYSNATRGNIEVELALA